MAAKKSKDIDFPLITRKEAAEYLGIPITTLDVWRSRGSPAIPFVQMGRLIKYSRRDLERWVIAQTRTETKKS